MSEYSSWTDHLPKKKKRFLNDQCATHIFWENLFSKPIINAFNRYTQVHIISTLFYWIKPWYTDVILNWNLFILYSKNKNSIHTYLSFIFYYQLSLQSSSLEEGIIFLHPPSFYLNILLKTRRSKIMKLQIFKIQ